MVRAKAVPTTDANSLLSAEESWRFLLPGGCTDS